MIDLRANERGQGTVEYAVVLFALLGVIAAFGVLSSMLSQALPVDHALQSASHHIQSAAPGAVGDVFMY